MTELEHKYLAAAGLRHTKQILDGMNVNFYLALGTCLGAYRDKDFCPGDIDDIDLFLDEKDYPRREEIIKAMIDGSWVLKARWEAEDGLSSEYSFRKDYDDIHVKVDLWFLSTDPTNQDNYIFRMYKTPEEYNTFTMPKKFYDNTITTEFYGTEYLIPEDIEGYLEHNYGKDWKTPIHRDNWDYYTANNSPLI